MDLKPILIVFVFVASTSQVTSLVPEIETLYTNGPAYSEYFPLQEILTSRSTLRLSVRASKDAHILLSTSPQRDQPEYEIVLGALDNTINYIRGRYPGQQKAMSAVRSVNMLNSKEFRNLWIRLKTDSRNTSLTIQVGIGDEVTPFQQWRDPAPLGIQYVSFRSETLARWRIGYSDEGYTIGIPRHVKQAFVPIDENGSRYGQYHLLYEIMNHSDDNSTTLYFTLKNSNEFQILLSPTASSSDDRYEFGLRRTSAYLLRQQATTTGRSTRNLTRGYAEVSIPNDNSRLRYWIKLNRDGQVMLGKGSSMEPILFWHDSEPIIPQFVGFTLIKEEGNFNPAGEAEIEYGLGADYTIESQDCKPRWKEAVDQKLPPGALRGGYTNTDELYVCRGVQADQLNPGSVFLGNENRGECHIAWGVNVHKKTEFQVLTGCHFTWGAASQGTLPECAFPTSEDKIYITRVYHENQVIIGKGSLGGLTAYVAFENQELPFGDYEVLAHCGANSS